MTHSVLGGHLLRARVTSKKDSVVLKSALVRIVPHCTDLCRNVTHSVLGSHLSRARVTVENKLGGFQECASEDFTLLN